MSALVGYRELSARLQAMGQTRELMSRIGLETVREARLTVANKTRTTSRTIRLASVTDTTATVSVGGAGLFLEFGTKPHIIRARNGKALRWPAKGTPVTLGGRARTGAVRKLGKSAYAFATSVNHPGTKAQPFLFPSATKALDAFGVEGIVTRWNEAA